MVKKFEDMFIRFDMIHKRDRRTDRRTNEHRMTAIAALMHIASRGKNCEYTFIRFDRIHERDRQTHRHCMTAEAALMQRHHDVNRITRLSLCE